jgi:hypothetical protein
MSTMGKYECTQWKRRESALGETENDEIAGQGKGRRKSERRTKTPTHHVPQPRHAQVAPRPVDLALGIKTPNRLAPVAYRVAADLAHAVARVAEPA